MIESLIGAEALLGLAALRRPFPASKRLDVAGTVKTTINAGISGSTAVAMALTKFGSGALTLNGAAVNTYTGATTVSAGNLSLNYSNLSAANSRGTLRCRWGSAGNTGSGNPAAGVWGHCGGGRSRQEDLAKPPAGEKIVGSLP